MNNTIEEKLLELLKTKLIHNLNKGIDLDFPEIKKSLDLDLGTELKNYHLEFISTHYYKLVNISYLHSFLQEEFLQELILHSPYELQLANGMGGLRNFNIDCITPYDYELSLQLFAYQNQEEWNYLNPFSSFYAKLNGKSYRATLIHHSLTATGSSKLFLRIIKDSPFLISDFIQNTNIDIEEKLKYFVSEKKNILVSGSTGSGKTSFLKSLLNHVSKNEHVVILEDTHEISLDSSHTTNLISSTQSKYKTGVKSLKDFCAYALRIRPDRIILGELRSDEVVPFTLAMNTGHKGLMSSLHADNARDALSRVSLLFSLFSQNNQISFDAIMGLVCQNIDYVIHLDKTKITEIIEVKGSEKSKIFFDYVYKTTESVFLKRSA